jgi:hypothetical protein
MVKNSLVKINLSVVKNSSVKMIIFVVDGKRMDSNSFVVRKISLNWKLFKVDNG